MMILRSGAAAVCLFLTSVSLQAAPPPAATSSPAPANAAVSVSTSVVLAWAAASRAQRYDVYLGTSSPLTQVSADQISTTFAPPVLTSGTTYYWRVDAKNGSGTTAGPTWSFATAAGVTAPPAAGNPSPTAGATGVSSSSTVLSWSAATGAAGYDVAFGSTNPPPLVSPGQPAT
jgi:hypothetical protein